MRRFPNFETFVALGLDASQVRVSFTRLAVQVRPPLPSRMSMVQVVLPSVRYSQMLHDFFPVGPTLPDAADAPGASFKVTGAAAVPTGAAHRELLRIAKLIHGHTNKAANASAT